MTGFECGLAPGSHPHPLLFLALLFPSSLKKPHGQLETPPSTAWPSPSLSFLSSEITPLMSARSFPSVLIDLPPLVGQAERTPVPHSETGGQSCGSWSPRSGSNLWADWLATRPSSEMGMNGRVPRVGSYWGESSLFLEPFM